MIKRGSIHYLSECTAMLQAHFLALGASHHFGELTPGVRRTGQK